MRYVVFLVFSINSILFAETISLERETIYNSNENLSKKDLEKINNSLHLLIQSVLDRDKSKLLNLVSPKEGIYVEENSFKTFAEFEKELKESNSYIDIFFFDTEKLIQHTKNPDSKTVRDLLILSKGLNYELYVDSSREVTIKFKFFKNRVWERELNQAILKKDKLKWYLYKLF
jgi:hypothetical protein